jgi:dipeptidyl aminopeptidase/acylaminoacyl peptidase
MKMLIVVFWVVMLWLNPEYGGSKSLKLWKSPTGLHSVIDTTIFNLFSVPEGEFYYPELYTHQISSGDILYAMVFKPHCFQPGNKYPTVLNIYGGPEVQLVSNTFKVGMLATMS